MSIHVVCTGCKTSFQVNEKFAGKKGPCPKCKAIIQVPEKSDEIVIHAPEPTSTTKDGKTRVAVKPLARREARFSRNIAIAAGVFTLVALACALYLRTFGGKVPQLLVIAGAVLLGPPIAWAGYGFLRNDEYEALQGRELWLRAAICGLVYAVLWGVYAYVMPYAFDTKKLSEYQLLFVMPPMVAVGGVAAMASLELAYGASLIHYAFYLTATVILAYVGAVPVF